LNKIENDLGFSRNVLIKCLHLLIGSGVSRGLSQEGQAWLRGPLTVTMR